MPTTAQIARFWDKAATGYIKDPVKDSASYQETLALISARLESSDHVVELGAGSSATAAKLAPMVAQYLSTDISSEMVRIGRAVAGDIANLDIRVATIGDQDIAQEQYDVVIALNLMHLVPDVDDMLRKISAILKPGGYFISKTPCLGENPLIKRAVFATAVKALTVMGRAPGKPQFLKRDTWQQRVANEGYDILETYDDHSIAPRRFIVARKKM